MNVAFVGTVQGAVEVTAQCRFYRARPEGKEISIYTHSYPFRIRF